VKGPFTLSDEVLLGVFSLGSSSNEPGEFVRGGSSCYVSGALKDYVVEHLSMSFRQVFGSRREAHWGKTGRKSSRSGLDR